MEEIQDIKKMKLGELFYYLLIDKIDRKLEDDEESYMPLFYPGTEKEIYERIHYFKNGNSKLNIELNEEKKKKLYIWARNNTRYEFLNSLIYNFIRELLSKDLELGKDDTDVFLVSNLIPIINIICKEIKSIVEKKENIDYSEFCCLSKEDTIKYVKEILLVIDPSKEWLKMYEQILNSNKVLYYNEMSKEEVLAFYKRLGLRYTKDMDNSFINIGNDTYLMLNYMGNVRDVSYTIHEIIHYINRTKIGSDEYIHTLDEFFSIFYQLYALDYLENKGYNKKDIDSVRKYILCDNASVNEDSYLFILKLRHYVKMALQNGKIEEKEDVSHYHNNEKLAHIMCDTFTNDFLMNEEYVLMKYHYLIGDYLAKYGIQKMRKGEDILPMMKYYTEHTLEIDPYDVFTLVGIDTEKLGIKKANYSLLNNGKKKMRSNNTIKNR